ncbi:HEAT repeat domain-containing protein [Streptomyces sp. NBC_01207]|uniref:HEAT repeat domain-containing protein n=1 Tax=Streptomyces sp. NBC_01207 TaxID=2903772 RepID=UPI002E111BC1|nr:HEAT repeat domain-containing protein [Streptomyces sp. NBC_01207]
MTGSKSPTAWIEWAWQELDAPDAGRRDGCLEVVSDVLETGLLARGDAVRVVERLVAVALSDESYELRESALHALCTATTPYELPYLVVAPLAAADGMEPLLLEYVLGVLGATGDRAALPAVERFLRHPDPGVRCEAADAVKELRWRLHPAREGTA